MEVFFFILGLLFIVGAILGSPLPIQRKPVGPGPSPTPTNSLEDGEAPVPWETKNAYIDHPDDLR